MSRFLLLTMKWTIAVGLYGVSLLAAGPEIGVWKLNLEKSQFSPGPPPRSFTLRFEPQGEGYRLIRQNLRADGKRTSTMLVIRFDGKDYPQDVVWYADTISSVRIDRFTTAYTFKKAGAVVATSRYVVSPDGKVLTRTSSGGINRAGQRTENVEVFEKQEDKP